MSKNKPSSTEQLNRDLRKAAFREEARNIVSEDRETRKYGGSVDTAGAIARAMERAYKLGLEHGGLESAEVQSTHTSDNVPPDWIMIPPKCRHDFEFICRNVFIPILVPDPRPWGNYPDLWGVYWSHKNASGMHNLAHTKAQSTLRPLEKMDLVERRTHNGDTYLLPTEKGMLTYQRALAEGKVIGPLPSD